MKVRKSRPSIAIITDTDSSIPDEIADQLNIIQVPSNIHIGEQTLRACVDIDDAGIFDHADRAEKYPNLPQVVYRRYRLASHRLLVKDLSNRVTRRVFYFNLPQVTNFYHHVILLQI